MQEFSVLRTAQRSRNRDHSSQLLSNSFLQLGRNKLGATEYARDHGGHNNFQSFAAAPSRHFSKGVARTRVYRMLTLMNHLPRAFFRVQAALTPAVGRKNPTSTHYTKGSFVIATHHNMCRPTNTPTFNFLAVRNLLVGLAFPRLHVLALLAVIVLLAVAAVDVLAVLLLRIVLLAHLLISAGLAGAVLRAVSVCVVGLA